MVTAESCTGGWVSQALTAIAGSSDWFLCGWVTYSNPSKIQLLNVSDRLLEEHGAVSEACARAMTDGALQAVQADWALAITGIAGPGGGSIDKPVGTVWIAWGGRDGYRDARRFQFSGGRAAIRGLSVAAALNGLLHRLAEPVIA